MLNIQLKRQIERATKKARIETLQEMQTSRKAVKHRICRIQWSITQWDKTDWSPEPAAIATVDYFRVYDEYENT